MSRWLCAAFDQTVGLSAAGRDRRRFYGDARRAGGVPPRAQRAHAGWAIAWLQLSERHFGAGAEELQGPRASSVGCRAGRGWTVDCTKASIQNQGKQARVFKTMPVHLALPVDSS